MDLIRGYKYRLRPTDAQAAHLSQFCGVCRLIYNLALEQRRTWGRAHRLGYHEQIRELKDLRAEFDWIGAVSQTAQTQAMMDLDRAFKNLFAGRAKFPKPRKKGVDDSFRVMGREVKIRRLSAKWSEIKLPKIGWVRFRDTRPMAGVVRNVTVSRGALGWEVSIACLREIEAPEHKGEVAGGDRGVTVPLMMSDGRQYALPESLEKVDKKARRAQKIASRKTRGSKRHSKAQRRVSKLKAKAARIRRHWQHQVSLDVAQRYSVVVLEDLKTKNMTRSAKGTIEEPGRNVAHKRGLSRSILNVGWHGLMVMIGYKLEERGGQLLLVDPKHTSQTCSCCGMKNSESRNSQAVFECVHCGFAANADHNAAINILTRGLPTTAPEHGVDARGRECIGIPVRGQSLLEPRTNHPSEPAAKPPVLCRGEEIPVL